MANTQPRKPHGKRNCNICGTLFEYFHINQVRCSGCQKDYWNRKNRTKTWHLKCKDCGVDFIGRNHDKKRCDDCEKIVTCDICGKTTKRTGHGQRYCSKACRQVTQQDNFYDGNYSKVMKRDGFACRRCGGNNGLSVHHIDHSGDGLKEKYANNDLDNLIVLCSSCHAIWHSHISRLLVKRHLDETKQLLSEYLES